MFTSQSHFSTTPAQVALVSPPVSSPPSFPSFLQQQVEDVKKSTVSMKPSSVVLRAMGRKTRSQRIRSGKGDRVFSLEKPIVIKPTLPDNKVFRYTGKYFTTVASSTTVPTASAYDFTVGAINEVSTLSSLFDQYRIVRVEVLFTPRNLVTVGGTNSGRFTTVIDYDDAVALGSELIALDYNNAITTSGHDGQYRSFQPHAAEAAYSGTFTSYANVPSPWIDAASAGVLHYGVKTVWTATDSVNTYDIEFALHTEWRNVR